MKGNIYDRIFIPKPCHEDWSKMTPDEKGAFCKSCNKSVYDFTQKNEAQVESILTAAKGQEVCGRFNPAQLASAPELEIPIYLLPRNIPTYRKFVLAVFIVFGTALFGCVNSYGQKMGRVRIVDTPVVTDVEEITFKGEVMVQEDERTKAPEKLPAVKVEPVTLMGDTVILPPQTIIENELYLLGGISMIEIDKEAVEGLNNIGPVEELEPIDEPAAVTEPARIACGLIPVTEEMIQGNIVITQELPVSYADVIEQEKVIEPVEIIIGGIPGTYGDVNNHYVRSNDEPDNEEEISEVSASEQYENENNPALTIGDGAKPSLECYPNPSSGPVNIRYEIKKRCDVKLELYDRSGRKVRTLLESKGYYNGIYNTTFDLSDLDAGTYICVLQAGDQLSSAKVVITK